MKMTSATHPLWIAEVRPGGLRGVIGMTFCPGKVQRNAVSGDWERDLEADVRAIGQWGATAVLTLLTPGEMRELQVERLPRAVVAAGMAHHLFPIPDFGVPEAGAEEAWAPIGADLRARLVRGERVLVHCKGGLGRTGMMSARLLVELGCDAGSAIRVVREARPGAIESDVQEQYVRRQRRAPDAGSLCACAPAGDGRARDRFTGCLLGGAVGDALGAPIEFASADDVRVRFGAAGLRDYAPAYGRIGAITDDTQMTLFTAEGLIRGWLAGGGAGPASLERAVALAYQRWLRTQGESSPLSRETEREPPGWLFAQGQLHGRRAPGGTCLSALRAAVRAGEPATNDSKGSGGVMRMAPAGLFGWCLRERQGPDETFALGAALARLTHGHPTGYLAAGALAVLVRALVEDRTLAEGLVLARAALLARPGHEETLAAVDAAEQLARSGVAPQAAIRRLGGGWTAEQALAIGVYCALVAPGFEEGVLLAVNHDGDSDSTGSVAGNLLGAALGVTAIPERWLAPLELREVIAEIACDLHSLVDPARPAGERPGLETLRKYPAP